MEYYLSNPEATENFGKVLGQCLPSGAVLCLKGDLGTGKTLLTRGVAAAFGVDDKDVVSPTFTIMNIYQGTQEIRHFDLYRLEHSEELDDVGFDEYCGGEGITVVEWADLFPERMPEEAILIYIERQGEGRKITLVAQEDVGESILEKLEHEYSGN